MYVLILVGGIVRSTGSGMGCPDWPNALEVGFRQHPLLNFLLNYKEIYAAHREKRTIRFAKYLTAVGMEETATSILNDAGGAS